MPRINREDNSPQEENRNVISSVDSDNQSSETSPTALSPQQFRTLIDGMDEEDAQTTVDAIEAGAFSRWTSPEWSEVGEHNPGAMRISPSTGDVYRARYVVVPDGLVIDDPVEPSGPFDLPPDELRAREERRERERIEMEQRRTEEHFNQRQQDRLRRERNEAERRRRREMEDVVRNIEQENMNRAPGERFDMICVDCQVGIVSSRQDTYRIINNNPVCGNCVINNYCDCRNCGDTVSALTTPRDYQGNRVCRHCSDSDYSICYACEHLVPHDDVEVDTDGEQYCPRCLEDITSERDNNSNSMENFEDDDLNDDDEDGEYDPDEPRWRRYSSRKLKKFCSEDEGAIVKTRRVFSAELETKFPEARVFNRLMRKLPKELGAEYDGSISGNGAEFQTPKLQGANGEQFIVELCKNLNAAKFKTDRTCGLHIHLDGGHDFIPTNGTDTRNHNGNNLKILFLFYLIYEDVIHSFLPRSRRSNTFCKPIKENYHISEIMNTNNLDEIEKIWYRTSNRANVANCKREKKNGTRYAGVNFHTLISENHLEIRYHSGTINATKVLEWSNLHGLIMDKVARGAITFQTITDSQNFLELKPKTEKFFDLVGLKPSSRKYFEKRQEKFLTKTTSPDYAEEEFKDEEVLALQTN